MAGLSGILQVQGRVNAGGDAFYSSTVGLDFLDTRQASPYPIKRTKS